MRHRALWRTVGLGVLAAGTYALWRTIEDNRRFDDTGGESPPFPPPAGSTPERGWVDPVDAACPASHPVKAKLSSGIFHAPGAANYARTVPDRCYRDPSAAEADGLRRSRR